MTPRTIVVTGGAGFIGSALVRHLVSETEHRVVNIDKLTYAATLSSLASVAGNPRYAFEQADVTDRAAIAMLLNRHRPDAIVHLAAETHVDRSIDGAAPFIETNIGGTYALLEAFHDYWQSRTPEDRTRLRFHHVSTDEVYGSLPKTGRFREESPYSPRSPYSASKAASDHLVMAWHHTFGLPVVITNSSNNYGPFQFPEKLVPLMILNALAGKPLPVYGNGENVRDWIHVDDHVRAIVRVLADGVVGEKYLVGAAEERTNLELVHALVDALGELRPRPGGGSYRDLVAFVADRPGHDLRYAVDAGKIRRELGWAPQVALEVGIRSTVEWYLANQSWWEAILAGTYRGERLGRGR